MEPLWLGSLLSEEKSGKRRRGRRRRRQRSRSGKRPPKETNPAAESEEVERALARFSIKPRPMGIPKEIDPPPKRIDLRWRSNPVSKDVQQKAGKIACLPGEFGFLP